MLVNLAGPGWRGSVSSTKSVKSRRRSFGTKNVYPPELPMQTMPSGAAVGQSIRDGTDFVQ